MKIAMKNIKISDLQILEDAGFEVEVDHEYVYLKK